MLGRYGETLVVDWGLAKAIGKLRATGSPRAEFDPDETRPILPPSGESAAPTQSTVGTPNYMSPEQARNDEIGPATDIFSLGSTLYYLLCGRAPYVVECEDRRERQLKTLALARACEFSPPREVAQNIPPALDAICLKAMRKDPGERYESAQALADDIECWLGDEPVSAYNDPWIDRFVRVLRRHRTMAAGIAAILVTALIATSVIAVIVKRNHSREIEANEQLAESNNRLDESNARLTSTNRKLAIARERAEEDLETARALSFELIDHAEGTLRRHRAWRLCDRH